MVVVVVLVVAMVFVSGRFVVLVVFVLVILVVLVVVVSGYTFGVVRVGYNGNGSSGLRKLSLRMSDSFMPHNGLLMFNCFSVSSGFRHLIR